MTDERDRGRDRNREPLITRAEALARAQRLRQAMARPPVPETAAPLERIGGLHDLLRDMAAYLGDRPQRDAEAMGLYERVMRTLGEGGG